MSKRAAGNHCGGTYCRQTRSSPDQFGRTCGCSCENCNAKPRQRVKFVTCERCESNFPVAADGPLVVPKHYNRDVHGVRVPCRGDDE